MVENLNLSFPFAGNEHPTRRSKYVASVWHN